MYFLLSSAFSSPLLYWTVLSSSFSGLTTLYPLSDNTPLSRSDHVLFPGFFCNYLFHGSLFGTLRLKSILVHLHTDCFVSLQCQHIVCPFFLYFLRYCSLRSHCIDCYDLAFYLDLVQQFRSLRSSAFFFNCFLSKTET